MTQLNLMTLGMHLALVSTLTGCEGVYDAFHHEAIPQHVTDSPQSHPNVSSKSETASESSATRDETPQATLTSSAGFFEGDPEIGGLGPTSNERSGRRIRAKMLLTDDGDRSFQGWYDSERDEDCDFVRDSEGRTRCLPLSVQTAPDGCG